MFKKVALLFCILFCFACEGDKETFPLSDHMVFGIFHGECLGDCFQVYRVTDAVLEEDISTTYFSNDYRFVSGSRLSNAQFNQARQLLSQIPTQLITEDTNRYGCPDCADQGGVYLFFVRKGIEREVRIDTRDTDDQSEALIEFKDKIIDLIRQLGD